MELSIIEFLTTVVIISLGAILQASTGLGAGLIVVPLLALIRLDFIPGPVIFASLILSLLMAYRGKAHIKTTGIHTVLTGLFLGMVAGAVFITVYSMEHVGVLFGVLILFAVFVSATGIKFSHSTFNVFSAGALSGFMGTTAAIGAPILALLYQYESGVVLRATLGLLYFVSSIAMLLLLHFAGLFNISELILGIVLIPGFILGYLLAQNFAKFLDKGYSRLAVLLISSISAFVLIIKSI